jgi:phage shock protein A
MFEGMKKRLERALDALEKRGPGPGEDDIDRILAGMREELIDARARVKGLEDEVRALERKLERVPANSEAAETLRHKLEGAKSVLVETRAEAAELTRQFRDAVGQRDALAIRSRTARTSEDLREGMSGPSRTFDRLAEKVEDAERLTRAERELDDDLGGGPAGGADLPPEVEAAERQRHADALLEELKRRMGVNDAGEAEAGEAEAGEAGGEGAAAAGEGAAEAGEAGGEAIGEDPAD